MESTYTKPPRTLLEVFEQLPEGTLAQFVNNQIILSPAPTEPHQKILDKIYRRLGDFVEENNFGETRTAPYDVYLNRRNAFQPDIVFIATGNLHNIKNNGLHGAPDLVIEILSPATWRLDKEDKKDEYEHSGVKEYWMVDPATKITEGFHLVNGEFQPLPSEPGKLVLKLLNLTISF
jgi:Uma2 family endonuclease